MSLNNMKGVSNKMLRRKIYDKLLAWKKSKGKKDAILICTQFSGHHLKIE